MKKIHHGVRGRRLKIEPEKNDTLLVSDDASLIQKGKIIGVGPDTLCKVGDMVIFNAWGVDRVDINGEIFYYILDTDEFVLEILP